MSGIAEEDRAVVPEGRRAELVQVLVSGLIGPAACDEYCLTLEAELARRGLGQGADIPAAELPLEALLRDGLGVPSDDQLARLAACPPTIRWLSETLWQAMADGAVGDLWEEAGDSVYELPPDSLGPDALRRVNDHIRDLDNG